MQQVESMMGVDVDCLVSHFFKHGGMWINFSFFLLRILFKELFFWLLTLVGGLRIFEFGNLLLMGVLL